ncbi:MAG: hypothetical protein WA885_04675 [Phormidesmis sp.]
MTNTFPPSDPAKTTRKGILLAGLLVLLVMIFGAKRQLIAQQYLSATAGTTVETELIDISGKHSPSIEVVTQLQYTQQALFKAEVVSGKGDSIQTVSQDVNSRNDESTKRVDIPNWPDAKAIKVKLSVASQSITAAPPAGADPAQAPVIFEVNVYSQWFNRRYLWPALFACIGLLAIANLAAIKTTNASKVA